jgi:hypothetical protein
MTKSTTARLASAEYEFLRCDDAIGSLADSLHACAHDSEAAGEAALELRRMRRKLRQVLNALDKDVTAAVLAFEAVEAPFKPAGSRNLPQR